MSDQLTLPIPNGNDSTEPFMSNSPLKRFLKPTVVYDTYWKFACERQNIFFERLSKSIPPWTSDPILGQYKFTNVYRASDRVSQFLIRNVIYSGDANIRECFFRIILFKLFNKIETWKLLESHFGSVTYSDFNLDLYDKILSKALENGTRIYSAAYIMPSGGHQTKSVRKHRFHLELLQKMMKDFLPERVTDAKSMGTAFDLLKSYPSIGDFLAYQFIIDINYSTITNFSENSFVVPGPGAKSGIAKCFQSTCGLTESEIIKVVMEHQDQEFSRLNLQFKNLWGRSLQLIDCQNLFCEVDKYARIRHPEYKSPSGRNRIKQKFQPNTSQLSYWYPPKWNINHLIQGNVQ